MIFRKSALAELREKLSVVLLNIQCILEYKFCKNSTFWIIELFLNLLTIENHSQQENFLNLLGNVSRNFILYYYKFLLHS